MNPAFEKALQARLLWMQVRSYGRLGLHHLAGDFALQAYLTVNLLARNEARDALQYGADCPMMLSDVPRLVELYEQTWAEETQEIELEREEVEQYCRHEQAKAYALACIERNDWEALGLPTPEHLSAELYAGRPMRVNGHFLHYEDGIVWMDNPYGVEGCLGEEPTFHLCRQFLIRLAKGGMYGPEP